MSFSNLAVVLTLEELERRHIERVLLLMKGNMSKTAKLLGIDRRTLYRKIQADPRLRKAFDYTHGIASVPSYDPPTFENP